MPGAWGASTVESDHVLWDCEECHLPRQLTVLGRWPHTEQTAQGRVLAIERVVAKCEHCLTPYVFEIDMDLVDAFEGDKDESLEQRYPVEFRPLSEATPFSISRAYHEAVRARRHQLNTAAALMARRGVEAICAHEGESRGSLEAKLKKLQGRGVIDQRLYDWSNVVRRVGNAGAHDTDTLVTREDADDSLAFLEALANYLYTFRDRYEKYEARREERDATRAAALARRAAKETKAAAGLGSNEREKASAIEEPPF